MSHGPCHGSTGRMVSLINKYFTTYGFNSYSKKFCTACLTCAKNNPQGNVRPKRGQFPKSDYPFQTLHMDFIELNKSEVYKYCLVIVDAFSKWVELFPSRHADALTVAKAICKGIIPNYGIPQTIYSDNGSHFVNQVIQKIGEHLKIKLKNHCAYYPQSAGLVERTNGTVKSSLRKCMDETKRPWTQCLDLVKLHMRITPTGSGLTPFEIVHGRSFRLPELELLRPEDEEDMTLADYMKKVLTAKEVKKGNDMPDSPISQQKGEDLVRVGDWVFI